LLVEDDADSLRVMMRLLRHLGHEVVGAQTYAQAIQISRGRIFNLLIADFGLPDGDGCALIAHVAVERGIALTGYGMAEDLEKSLRAGFAAHLVKPVTLDHLQRVIDEVMFEPGPSVPRPLDTARLIAHS
jgi:CheY-like chemotaxis protein